MRQGLADRLRAAAEKVVTDGNHPLPDHVQLGVGPELVGDLLNNPGNAVLYR